MTKWEHFKKGFKYGFTQWIPQAPIDYEDTGFIASALVFAAVVGVVIIGIAFVGVLW